MKPNFRGKVVNPNATFIDSGFSATTDYYFYSGVLRRLHVQFASLFSELQVAVGKNGKSQQAAFMTVPVKIASMDRVVAAIKADNTQNVPIRLPAMAVQMVAMEIDRDRMSGLKTITRRTEFPLGSTFPDGGKVVYKLKPMPYRVTYELSIITRNQLDHDQILEQILCMFMPDIQIQMSDKADDWSSINSVELTAVSIDTPYATEDADNRLINTVLQFSTTAYISAPADITEKYIKKIKLKVAAVPMSQSFAEYFVDDTSEGITVADVTKMNIPPK